MRTVDRIRALVAIPSTNQMYSGVGRALMELCARMSDRVAFEFAIDDQNARNLDLLVNFARTQGLKVHVGRHDSDPRFVDPVNRDLPRLLERNSFEVIELIGFANAATGRTVLDSIGDATLAYTPHDQPLWTVPMTAAQREVVADLHRRVIDRADVVFADSPHERKALQTLYPGRNHVEFHPLGSDFDAFLPGPLGRGERLLFIGDLNEIRKRFDRVAAVIERLLPSHPDLKLIVVGNKSEGLTQHITPAIRAAIELRGYVDECELRALYRSSSGLLLLSEVEAFGLPILEALACGTPVYLSDLPTTRSLFGDFRSAVFCDPDDVGATAARVGQGLDRGVSAIADVVAERAGLQARFDWDLLAPRKADALAAAWWRRSRWSLSA